MTGKRKDKIIYENGYKAYVLKICPPNFKDHTVPKNFWSFLYEIGPGDCSVVEFESDIVSEDQHLLVSLRELI